MSKANHFLTEKDTVAAADLHLGLSLGASDPEIHGLIKHEEQRQLDNLRMIASENYASRAVLEACSSVLNNKYSEGYPQKRYYQGQVNVDQVEMLTIARLKAIFKMDHVNVQPYSGSPANLAVYVALAKPGDTVMGLGLPSGGHLTHGWSVSATGQYYKPVQYGVRHSDHRTDIDEAYKLAKEHKPKIIFCGATAYPRHVEYEQFAQIAKDVGAVLVADIAHVAGLVAGGAHPTPKGFANVITSTTHKTFRGPRGGMIMCEEPFAKAIDKAVFPGLQGGPHNASIAGLAVAAKEAATPAFKSYAHNIVKNAKALADAFVSRGISLVTGGTDTHLILCDLTNKNVSGKVAAVRLEEAGIVCNYNSVPFDTRKPFDPSGIRLGTPALTSRGMGTDDMARIGNWIADVIEDKQSPARVKAQVLELCQTYPAPGLAI